MNGKTRLPEIQLCVWKVFSEEDLKRIPRTPGGPAGAMTCASTGAQVQSLIGDLRSCIACSTANKQVKEIPISAQSAQYSK